MLVDPQTKELDIGMRMVLATLGQGRVEERPEPGIVVTGHWNFGFTITNMLAEYPDLPDDLSCIGVCDSIEQFKDAMGAVIASPRKFCVAFVRMRKDEQEEGGWRWHKWGPYIGTQDPQCEYLRDEPVVEEVMTFHIMELVG